jgi:hypothetical protein
MLAAKARAQAASTAFSVEAWDKEGESTAIDAAAKSKVRYLMMVFLV